MSLLIRKGREQWFVPFAASRLGRVYRGLEQICEADKTAASLIKARIEEIAELLERYMDEIERFNSAYGLVKIKSRDELIVKHILDSLAPLGHIARLLGTGFSKKSLADLGSGAGLPGIPLAVCMPELQVVLIERMGKRADFLRNTVAVLNSAIHGARLANVTVEETELEKAAGHFDLVTFRALSPLTPAFISAAARLCKSPQTPLAGGTIAAYKGKQKTASAELKGLTGYEAELVPLTVPFLNEERCLVVYKP
jgi:16S rRNA (guanine527-N7)-methyltransferase